MCCFGALCYFINAKYLYDDKNNVDMIVKTIADSKRNSMLGSLPCEDSARLINAFDGDGGSSTSDSAQLLSCDTLNTESSRSIKM